MAGHGNLREQGSLTKAFQEEASGLKLLAGENEYFDEHAREKQRDLKEKDYNYGIAGKEAPGRIATINHLAHNGAEFQSNAEKKRQRDFKTILDLQKLREELADMRDTLGDMMETFKDNQRKIKEGLEILRNKDVDAARVYLLDEYGIDAERMTDEEILAAVKDKVGDTIENQDDLIREMEDIAKRYKKITNDNPELEDEYLSDFMEEFEKLKKQAEQNHLDFESARDQIKIKVGDVKLLEEVDRTYEVASDAEDMLPNSANPFASSIPGIKL